MKLLFLILLPILTISLVSFIYAQKIETYSKEPKFYTIQRVLPDIDIFLDKEINTTNMVASSNQITEHVPKFFAIQHAQTGSISEINETTYSLELNDVSDKTILFSDRPDRIIKSTSTSNFIGNWTTGENSFTIDAPNTVLIVDKQEEIQDVEIIELYNPSYDYDSKTLKYDITADNSIYIELPNEFGQVTLVIDVLPCFPANICS